MLPRSGKSASTSPLVQAYGEAALAHPRVSPSGSPRRPCTPGDLLKDALQLQEAISKEREQIKGDKEQLLLTKTRAQSNEDKLAKVLRQLGVYPIVIDACEMRQIPFSVHVQVES